MAQYLSRRLNAIRPLRVFLTVYKAGSITKAAHLLNLTQPTISIQLRKLTEIIGTPLYKQVGRKLIFTEAADIIVAHSIELFETLDRLEISLADLKQIKAGTLRIAVVTSAKYFIPHLLGSFCRQYPLIEIQLTVGNRAKIIKRYKQDLDDIYLFSHLNEQMKDYAISFLANPLIAIAHQQHPLAQKKTISVEELCDHPFISRENGSGTRYAIESYFEVKGLTLTTKMTIESNEAIKHCVIAGLGISILSEYAIKDESNPSLVYLPVDGFPILTSWHLVRSAHRIQTALSEAFVNFTTEKGKNILSQTF
jgi:DNA-binding transcriptional LysR family regulator